MRLVVDNLTVARGDEVIVEGVTFSLASGEGIAVTGPNGSGKSTLLRGIVGLLRPLSGSVRLEGLAEDQSFGGALHFINTLNALKPALTVAENLSFWQAFHGAPWRSPSEALERLEIGHVLHLPLSDLSTGQKRRVSLSRLFLNKRPVWFLDEPTGGLDQRSEELFAAILSEHLADGGLFVAATHLPLGVKSVRSLRFEEGAPA